MAIRSLWENINLGTVPRGQFPASFITPANLRWEPKELSEPEPFRDKPIFNRIDPHTYLCQYVHMNKVKRITANLPEELLREAILVSKSNLTDTLVLGLKMVRRSAAYEKANALKGKLNLNIDLDVSRERHRR